jgi:4-hydroxy-4-methyl-2-oxoglutarate aldolase
MHLSRMAFPAMLASAWISGHAGAQVFKLPRQEMIRYTAQCPFERFPDGRPKVPDALLEKLKGLSAEEVFELESQGYLNQFDGELKALQPAKKLVGRALTLQLMPLRPDVADVDGTGMPSKASHITHQTAINLLQPGDVLVIDAHNISGGIIGDNLGYYIFKRAAGFVIDGAVRDLDGLREFDLVGYFREAVPPFLHQCMVTGINIPVQIGKTTVMPGDAVFGDSEGVYFIPPHLLQHLVDHADEIHVHDEWTKKKFDDAKYKSTDIYPRPKDPALKQEYDEYRKKRQAKE